MTATQPPFRGDFDREFPGWRSQLDPLFQAIEATPVLVLSWGPGENTPDFAKRDELCRDLRQNPANCVNTPEQLARDDPRLADLANHDIYGLEEILAEEADVVVCLLTRSATGVHGEIMKYFDNQLIRPKLRALIPKKPPTPTVGFIYRAAHDLPDSQKFRYTRQQYQLCEEMRSRCREWIEAVRFQKYRQLRHASQQNSGRHT